MRRRPIPAAVLLRVVRLEQDLAAVDRVAEFAIQEHDAPKAVASEVGTGRPGRLRQEALRRSDVALREPPGDPSPRARHGMIARIRTADAIRSPGLLLARPPHRGDNFVEFRPGLAQQHREKPALSRHHNAVVDKNVELSPRSVLQCDGTTDGLLDPGGVTRRSLSVTSSLAVDDPNAHTTSIAPPHPATSSSSPYPVIPSCRRASWVGLSSCSRTARP